MKRLLFVVDYQNDFVADDGKLSVGEAARKIASVICGKIKAYRDNGHKVFFTLDAHIENDWSNNKHPEGGLFPRHCIKGSEGYILYGEVKVLARDGEFINKRAYCPDFTDEKINSVIKAADEIEVCGVVTDICVFQTVLGLYTYAVNNGISVKLTVDAGVCASFNPDRETWALKYMREVLAVNVIE